MTKELIRDQKPEVKDIVLAEDDQDDMEFFRDVVTEVNPQARLTIVKDGKELLAHLSFLLPDLLFLDLDMPRKNGLECLIEIRTKPTLQKLPVVVFSSTSRPSNIQTAYEMGAHLFLVKSPVFSEYKSSIKAVMELDWTHPERIRDQYYANGIFSPFI